MQKTLLYLFLLLLFGGGVYYFVFDKEEAAFPESEAGFQVKDTNAIGTIFLSVPAGQSILLNHTDSGWILNKKYPVLQQTLSTLFTTLYLQKPLYPTPENAHNRVIRQMAGNGIKVELYDRKGKEMKVFYVGSEVHNYEGTTMLMQGAQRPYVVRMGEFIGLINSRYSVDIDNWRDRTIINFPVEDIRTVSITYPDAPLNSFTVKQNNGSYDVAVDDGIKGTQSVNNRRVKLFLGFFQNVVCEGYINGEQGLDSIIASVPLRCAIDITTQQGRHQHLDVYWMPKSQRSKNTDTLRDRQVPVGFDIDRYYAVGNNGQDTMIIQEYSFNKIFRKAYEFYQKDKEVDVVGLEGTK